MERTIRVRLQRSPFNCCWRCWCCWPEAWCVADSGAACATVSGGSPALGRPPARSVSTNLWQWWLLCGFPSFQIGIMRLATPNNAL